jgi:hypothetical protein
MLLMLVWFAIALVFGWRFQFSIRSLLVLTATAAVPCSWLSWEMKRAGVFSVARSAHALGATAGLPSRVASGGDLALLDKPAVAPSQKTTWKKTPDRFTVFTVFSPLQSACHD